jgi:hypothetical protein
VTVNVRATVLSSGVTVMVAVRVAPEKFGDAAHCTDAEPTPVVPEVIVSQAVLLLTTVQFSAGSSAVTPKVPLSPLGLALADDGLTLIVPGPWVIGNVTGVPDDGVTVIVADRLSPCGFGTTEKLKLLLPVPDVGVVKVTQV